jgi:hypothetical protein
VKIKKPLVFIWFNSIKQKTKIGPLKIFGFYHPWFRMAWRAARAQPRRRGAASHLCQASHQLTAGRARGLRFVRRRFFLGLGKAVVALSSGKQATAGLSSRRLQASLACLAHGR